MGTFKVQTANMYFTSAWVNNVAMLEVKTKKLFIVKAKVSVT